MSREMNKMSPEELEGLLHMRKRSYVIKPKKGRGSYTRKNKNHFSTLVY